MHRVFNFNDPIIRPIKLNYPFDEDISLKAETITFNDGFTSILEPALFSTKDIQINKNTLMILTSAVRLDDILDISQTSIDLSKVENKFGLQINSKFIVSSSDTLQLAASGVKLDNSGFFRFIPNNDNTISIQLGNNILTVNKNFPYEINFGSLIPNDTLEQQKFDYNVINDQFIRIKTRLHINTPGNRLRRYLSYDPNDGYRIKAIGDENNPYDFKIISLADNNNNDFKTNFSGLTYWVKYFNSNSNQTNNKNVEINTDESIRGVPTNLLISSPYKTALLANNDTYDLVVNLSNLKNFQTPEYEYTDNSFFINKYQIYGKVITTNNQPLIGVSLSGFPETVKTDEHGKYSVLVDYDWSGIITITNAAYTFSPSAVNYDHVEIDTQQDYIATLNTYSVYGYVLNELDSSPVEMVHVAVGSLFGTTDQYGFYSITVPYDWTGFLIPSTSINSIFTPPSAEVTPVREDIEFDFTVSIPKVTISGHIQNNTSVLDNGYFIVTDITSLGGSDTIYIDGTGNYSFQVPVGWNQILTPQNNDPSVFYTPSAVELTDVELDTFANFTLDTIMFTISGTVSLSGIGLSGIPLITSATSSLTAYTSADGTYSLSVPYDWSDTLTPTSSSYDFTPLDVVYVNLENNIIDNYTAEVHIYYNYAGDEFEVYPLGTTNTIDSPQNIGDTDLDPAILVADINWAANNFEGYSLGTTSSVATGISFNDTHFNIGLIFNAGNLATDDFETYSLGPVSALNMAISAGDTYLYNGGIGASPPGTVVPSTENYSYDSFEPYLSGSTITTLTSSISVGDTYYTTGTIISTPINLLSEDFEIYATGTIVTVLSSTFLGDTTYTTGSAIDTPINFASHNFESSSLGTTTTLTDATSTGDTFITSGSFA